ncbi:MAG: hypothetical protein J0I81_00015, partial [Hyphomicrobium sp.]|nr:hypothetical protein [Hyphomicrobium sp.]
RRYRLEFRQFVPTWKPEVLQRLPDGYKTHNNILRPPQFPKTDIPTVTVLRRLAMYPVVFLLAMVANALPADLAVYEKACSAN